MGESVKRGAMNKKFSVVMPMFNCCQNVVSTLRELAQQANNLGVKDSLQVIVVDDGSTEDSTIVLDACEMYGFNYYWQENAGGAAACNFGLSKVDGEYFSFVDADDSVTCDYLSAIFKEIKDSAYDFITNRWQYPNGIIGIKHEPPLVNWNVWGNIYRSDKCRSVKFDEDINVAWDVDWLRRAYQDGMKQYDSNSVTYIYDTSNPDSITNRFHRGEIKIRKSDGD